MRLKGKLLAPDDNRAGAVLLTCDVPNGLLSEDTRQFATST